MPIVTVQLLEGRTDEQKKALVESVTNSVTETTGARKEAVTVVIEEMKNNTTVSVENASSIKAEALKPISLRVSLYQSNVCSNSQISCFNKENKTRKASHSRSSHQISRNQVFCRKIAFKKKTKKRYTGKPVHPAYPAN